MSGDCPISPFASKVTISSTTRNLSSSSMSGKKFSRAFGVQLWTLDVEWPPMSRAEFDPIYSFMLSQDGSYGNFTFAAHDRRTPRGIATGTPLVNGASQTGNSLVTDGWTHSKTGIMKAGDLIKLSGSNKVYWVTADANSNSSGQATLSIYPALIASPADNEALTVSNVPFSVSLTLEVQEYETDQPDIYTYKASLIESL